MADWIEQFMNEAEQMDDELDFDDFELPQLVRRHGMIEENQEYQQMNGFKCLEQISDKMYLESECPICLTEMSTVPLKCGHTFCQNDIEILILQGQDYQNIVKCPICRQHQQVNNVEELLVAKNCMIQ